MKRKYKENLYKDIKRILPTLSRLQLILYHASSDLIRHFPKLGISKVGLEMVSDLLELGIENNDLVNTGVSRYDFETFFVGQCGYELEKIRKEINLFHPFLRNLLYIRGKRLHRVGTIEISSPVYYATPLAVSLGKRYLEGAEVSVKDVDWHLRTSLGLSVR